VPFVVIVIVILIVIAVSFGATQSTAITITSKITIRSLLLKAALFE